MQYSTDQVAAAPLLKESADLLAKARERLLETQHTTTKEHYNMEMTETTSLTPERAGELYASGKTVIEVARAYGMPYSKARKLIAASGTPIRDASARLKGRTRTSKSGA